MSKIIISDTSCLIALDRIGHLELLQKIFTIVYTTKIVAEEFEKPLPDWILVKEFKDEKRFEELKLILDEGEASAIVLALELKKSILIIDEKKGRKVASDLKLQIIGTLKILLIAKDQGVIVSVKQLIDKLQKHSFRFNQAVIDEILKLAAEN